MAHFQVRLEEQTREFPVGLEKSKEASLCNLAIEVLSLNTEEIIFDLKGVDVSIANALRRILIAEVPTVAVENVWITENSGLVQDEVLAHRVGLVPIKVDPRRLDFVQEEAGETDADTLVFHLDVHFPQNGEAEIHDDVQQHTGVNVAPSGCVLSSHLKWLPIGSQKEMFPEGVEAVHPDIVLTKLRPGQGLEFEAHCRKGFGRDHAKFQPVATASYRLMPEVILAEDIRGDEAKELVALCPDVFDIEDMGGAKSTPRAKVKNPRKCTMCRECIRKDHKVKLCRKVDHFLFTVESVGSLSPQDIVEEALKVLKTKASTYQEKVKSFVN